MKTNIVQPNVCGGDLVQARKGHKSRYKLGFPWTGPRVVFACVNNVEYVVNNIVNGKEDRVHATRTTLDRQDWKHKKLSDTPKDYATHTEAAYEIIDEIIGIGEAEGELWIQVKWLGLPDETDFTWQKLSELYQDVPEMVQAYLKTCKKRRVVSKARTFISAMQSSDCMGAS